jgi:hypothetical protein
MYRLWRSALNKDKEYNTEYVSEIEHLQYQREQDKRFMTLYHKLGLTEDGTPTGNGLIHRIEKIEEFQAEMRPEKVLKRIVAAAVLAGTLWTFFSNLVFYIVEHR